MTSFRILSTTAFACSLALAVVETVLSYLCAVYVWNPECAGKAHLQGFRMGIDDFVGLPLMVWLVVLIVRKIGKDPKAESTLERDFVVFEFRTFRLTDGMVIVYSVLFGMVAGIGLLTIVALKRYAAISGLCQTIWNSS